MHLITTYLILLSIISILCYPTRPLDERAPELAWQAWLLVDDQNQNRQNNDPAQSVRRRITPKSVFIAPTFSPELLPPCADGYRSDTMGRCIKIIKLDESAHLNFILEKLNEKFAPDFGDYNEYDDDEESGLMTDGPEKVNIPLIDGDNVGDINDNTNIAIVVAPTNTNFPLNVDKRAKVDVKRNGNDETTTTTTSLTEETTLETTTDVNFESTTDSFETTTVGTTLMTSTTDLPTETTTDFETTTTTTVPTTSFQPTVHPTNLLSNPIRFPNVDSETNRRFVRFPSDLDSQTTPASVVVLTKRPIEQQNNNHRSRDRNLFVLPTNWNQSSLLQQHKPVVFRFSRKHTYVDTQQFNKRPDYYRTVPSDDLSYIFGFKHKQNNINSSIR